MADFYFYTDLNLLSSQTKEQSFGPVENSDPDFEAGKEKFRVTNRHSATTDPLAYAVCNGTILAIKNSTPNTNLLTLVLKPSIQDSKIFPRVKYFVYRGIKLDSLISGSGTSEIITSTIDNTFTKFIYDKISDKSSKILLGDIDNASFDPLESLDNFYYSNSQSQFVEIDGGWSIGRFDKDHIGFEIILDTVSENLPYSSFTNEVSYITNTNLGTSKIDKFKALNSKERIHNYIDPCAFYGNFLQNSHFVWARNSNDDIDSTTLKPKYVHDPNDPFLPDNKKSNFKIYTDILNAANIQFWNRNKIYIDLRNELNFSFNYMRNYTFLNSLSVDDDSILFTSFDNGNSLEDELTTSASNILKINYYRSNWPLLIVDDTDILNSSLNSKNNLHFSFPKGDNADPLAYVEFSKIRRNRNKKFLKLGYRGSSDIKYTRKNLILETLNYTNSSSTNEICCSYIRIKYLKFYKAGLVSSNGVLKQENYFDLVFPFYVNIPFEDHSDTVKYILKGDEIFIDPSNYLSGTGVYMAQIGRARDLKYVTYYSIATEEFKDGFSFRNKNFTPFPFSSGKTNLQSYFLVHLALKGKNTLVPQLVTTPSAGNQAQIQKFMEDDRGIFASISYKNDEEPYNLNQNVLAFCIPCNSDPTLDVYNDLVAKATPYIDDNLPVFISVTGFNDDEVDALNSRIKFAKLNIELKTFDLSGSSVQVLSIPGTQRVINGYNSRKL